MSKASDIPVYRKVDFGMWEKMYGRPLSDEEKKEIGERMLGFFRILIQADLKQKKEQYQDEVVKLEKTAKFYGVEI